MVGATSVGHITVSYDDDVETNRAQEAAHRHYDPAISVARDSPSTSRSTMSP